MKYNSQQFRSVISFIKEKAKISREISYYNGIIRGIEVAMQSEQLAFESKERAKKGKEEQIKKLDELKKAVVPLLNSYKYQMKQTQEDINGNF